MSKSVCRAAQLRQLRKQTVEKKARIMSSCRPAFLPSQLATYDHVVVTAAKACAQRGPDTRHMAGRRCAACAQQPGRVIMTEDRLLTPPFRPGAAVQPNERRRSQPYGSKADQ